MRVKVTGDGIMAELTHTEQGIVLKAAHPSKWTTRQVFEHYLAIMAANFEQDIADTIADLEETENV